MGNHGRLVLSGAAGSLLTMALLLACGSGGYSRGDDDDQESHDDDTSTGDDDAGDDDVADDDSAPMVTSEEHVCSGTSTYVHTWGYDFPADQMPPRFVVWYYYSDAYLDYMEDLGALPPHVGGVSQGVSINEGGDLLAGCTWIEGVGYVVDRMVLLVEE
jgi:hypothetical protein